MPKNLLIIAMFSVFISTLSGCASNANVRAVEDKPVEKPNPLIGRWDCEAIKSISNGDRTLTIESEWTEEISPDGKITHEGPISVISKDNTGKVQVDAEGIWSATNTTFTSQFKTVKLKALDNNELSRFISSDENKKSFYKPDTEIYTISSTRMTRLGNDKNVHVECLPSHMSSAENLYILKSSGTTINVKDKVNSMFHFPKSSDQLY